MLTDTYKIFLGKLFTSCGVDSLFRYINRKKLLAIMYHGITQNHYDPPFWTQLPESVFRKQIEFLKNKYTIVSLTQVLEAIQNDYNLPERSVLITFDDGLRNNYSVAFTILQEYSAPGLIFLATDFIDSEKVFWFDELFFLLQFINPDEILPEEIRTEFSFEVIGSEYHDMYSKIANKMKQMPQNTRERLMDKLRAVSDYDSSELSDDFHILTWEQIHEMNASGLIEFGVHTATHQIVEHLGESEWEKELKIPKDMLSNTLNKEVVSFCYPNGRPGIDFSPKHDEYLHQCEYSCVFTSETCLSKINSEDIIQIGRIPVGNDLTSETHYFRLSTSGLLTYIKTLKQKLIYGSVPILMP